MVLVVSVWLSVLITFSFLTPPRAEGYRFSSSAHSMLAVVCMFVLALHIKKKNSHDRNLL